MILTLEIPHQGKPHCWFAFDEPDFITKVQLVLTGSPARDPAMQIYTCQTPREQLAQYGSVPDSPNLSLTHPEIVTLAQEHGWDTPLYRADYLLAPGVYQTDALDEFVAHAAALAHHVALCRIYPDEELALEALEQDPLYAGRDNFFNHMALREQLIALEVLSDDL